MGNIQKKQTDVGDFKDFFWELDGFFFCEFFFSMLFFFGGEGDGGGFCKNKDSSSIFHQGF